MADIDNFKFEDEKSEIRKIAGIRMYNKYAVAEILNVAYNTLRRYINQMAPRKIGAMTWVAEDNFKDWLKGYELGGEEEEIEE